MNYKEELKLAAKNCLQEAININFLIKESSLYQIVNVLILMREEDKLEEAKITLNNIMKSKEGEWKEQEMISCYILLSQVYIKSNDNINAIKVIQLNKFEYK